MGKKYILSAQSMQEADKATIEEIGIGQEVLMERAALAVVKRVEVYQPKRVLCVCGMGNNGGDGLAVARILLMRGIEADVYMCGDLNKCKSSVKNQYVIFEKVGGKTITTLNFMEYDIIVDAIFGVGLGRSVEGIYAEVINAINESLGLGSKVIAVDIPSGIHTDTGAVMGCAVKADETVSFAYYKPGHLLYPGAEYCGNVTVEDIGINVSYTGGQMPVSFTWECKEPIILPIRPRNGNKGTFGRVLVIAGSASMYGACYLSALAALRMGAGLVDVFTHEINRASMQMMLPEAIIHTYCEADRADALDALVMLIKTSDCVVIGPGLSTNDMAVSFVKIVLEMCDKTIVADADALNCIAQSIELKMLLKAHNQSRIIMTPHPGELSRLTGKSVSELKADYVQSVRSVAEEYGCVVVGKDAGTVVSDGQNIYINQTGNSGMATAGSGDVLSGIIGALCVRNENMFDASCKGVFLHGRAGDYALESSNTHSLIASDIANALTEIIRE